ncbi:PEP-CTERM sorting domain-containing protein [Emcibacter sp.]|uniref:PEP-CTERM sorting domain-containing protein n=1 Tax=Emcibacter sp. TaxID=1979954 RepID=UPI003A8D4B23
MSIIAAIGLTSLTATANAGIISADIEVVMDLEFCCGVGPSVSTVNGAIVGPGAELTVADRTINPSDWGGHIAVDIDNDGAGFTLFNDDGSNVFQSAIVTISNITSDMGDIVNVVMTSNSLFTDYDEEDEEELDPFVLDLSFTANSIVLSVLLETPSENAAWGITENGLALFDITFAGASQEISEPAMLGLLGLGLVGLGLARRRVK